jgi:cyclic pyranopterin phosphate synthase
MPKKQLTHLDSEGRARMVDVTEKVATSRRAIAESFVRLSRGTANRLRRGNLPKGDALETARIAGILAAKRTPISFLFAIRFF